VRASGYEVVYLGVVRAELLRDIYGFPILILRQAWGDL
jgi:hypothetical protein